MTDYSNGQNILLKRPEPGRPLNADTKNVSQQVNVDVNAIANAVINAIVNKMPATSNINIKTIDDFDNSESLKKIADVMSNQGNNESNLEGIGKVKEVKKNKAEVDKAIDMLSQLGD